MRQTVIALRAVSREESETAMNMSYCRFENTLTALRECSAALADSGPDPFDGLSDDERKAAKRLMKLCREMADDYCEE